MGYVTDEDVELRLGAATLVQLTDDESSGVPNWLRVAEARVGAEGEVNGYLARRVGVPVDVEAWPELAGLLRSITLDLVEYRLRGRRPPIPADCVRRRAEAVQWLERVASGSAVLPSMGAMDASPSAGVVGAVTGPPRVMTRDSLEAL